MTGFTFGGPDGATLGGPDGATFGVAGPTTRPPVDPRGFTLGGRDGATLGGPEGATFGIGPPSLDELLADTEGFALALDPVPDVGYSREPRLYTETGREPAADGALIGGSVVLEAMAVSDISVTLPADADLFGLTFAEFALGYDGTRRFSGRIKPASGSTSDMTVSLTGFGPLDRLRSSDVDIEYSGMAAHEALQRFLHKEVRPRTDGRVRGVVIPPRAERGETVTEIPTESPLSLSGTLLSVLVELCGFAGMVFGMDHSRRDALIEVFYPASQLREARWEATEGGVKPSLDPGDYHTDVVIEGAIKPGVGEDNLETGDRYRGEASAPDEEVLAITGGERMIYCETNDEFESDAACREFARSKLDELRGQFQIGGTIDATPGVGSGTLTPGHVYRVPEFDRAAPAPLTPAVLPLYSVEFGFGVGEASLSLNFEPGEGLPLAGTLRALYDPPLALRGLSRLGPIDWTDREQAMGNDAYSAEYPHDYPTNRE